MERRNVTRTPQEVLALCREKDVRAVDLRFTDLMGKQHHLTVPASQLNEHAFADGFGFDGSSVRGWQSIDESDMLLVPLPDSAWIDPFTSLSTLVLACAIQDPITREDYARDPRMIAKRAENYLQSTGIADSIRIGPEAEFFIFDDVQFDQRENSGFYHIDSGESWWNRGRGESPNLGHKIRHGLGNMCSPPNDQTGDLRGEMMQTLIDCGIDVECHHHEIGSAGQAEIDIGYGGLLETADNLMTYKYIVKNVAKRHGKSVTFMPKPVMGDSGNGLHVHFSLWKNEDPLFAGKGYAGLSDVGLYAIGGVLKHAPALLAITNPTTNSYKRLVPGFKAPVNLTYSQRNRSAACRIPMVSPSPRAKRIEFRCPDPSCNPYLAFSAILMAAIDGIQNKIHPGDPIDKDLYDLPPEMADRVAQTPRSLEEAMQALEQDCDFLLRGDVFTEDLLLSWIEYKRQHEILPMQMRPHPYEFCLYYDS
ncbi:type I glutamate--ammonia ligase [Aureliella helgolandensis]|uniref:Glutamine synthetase n=1 Tax=Aureliella helgolandensis TaxID=2527968 RepID=A0A518G8R9_9BACT|nr:type I glutamate--ammonia ligase [Aureliella helgolandensis]QDV24988.1 Glutamine synthetase [Aureliella helgolandensis]